MLDEVDLSLLQTAGPPWTGGGQWIVVQGTVQGTVQGNEQGTVQGTWNCECRALLSVRFSVLRQLNVYKKACIPIMVMYKVL